MTMCCSMFNCNSLQFRFTRYKNDFASFFFVSYSSDISPICFNRIRYFFFVLFPARMHNAQSSTHSSSNQWSHFHFGPFDGKYCHHTRNVYQKSCTMHTAYSTWKTFWGWIELGDLWYEGLLVMQYGKSYDFTEEGWIKKTAFFPKHFAYQMHLMHFHCVLCWTLNTNWWSGHICGLSMHLVENEHFYCIVLYCIAWICSFNPLIALRTSSQVMHAMVIDAHYKYISKKANNGRGVLRSKSTVLPFQFVSISIPGLWGNPNIFRRLHIQIEMYISNPSNNSSPTEDDPWQKVHSQSMNVHRLQKHVFNLTWWLLSRVMRLFFLEQSKWTIATAIAYLSLIFY